MAQFLKDSIFIGTSSGWISVVIGTLVLECRIGAVMHSVELNTEGSQARRPQPGDENVEDAPAPSVGQIAIGCSSFPDIAALQNWKR